MRTRNNTSRAPVEFTDRTRIEAELGKGGLHWLEGLLDTIQGQVAEDGPALKSIKVCPIQDAEILVWHRTAIYFQFDSSFKEADRTLKQFYPLIDLELARLPSTKRYKVARQLFFDIETPDESAP